MLQTILQAQHQSYQHVARWLQRRKIMSKDNVTEKSGFGAKTL